MHDRARPKDEAPGSAGGRCAGSQQVGQAQPRPEAAQAANPHNLAAVPAITETNTRSEKTEHRNLSARDPELEKTVVEQGDCSDSAG